MEEHNPFETPRADEFDTAGGYRAEANEASFPWFLVGTKKLLLMTVLTFGLYSIHWFERQYRFQKAHLGESTWPLARGLFSIFFAHELFRRVDALAEGYDVARRWTASKLGGIYVGALIFNRVLDRVSDRVVDAVLIFGTTVLSLGLIGLAAWVLAQVQATLNEVADRAQVAADRNERLTVWNWLILVVFGTLVFFAMIGPFIPE